MVPEAQACQAEAQSKKNSWLLKIGNFWQSRGLGAASAKFCNACTKRTESAEFTFAVRSGRHGRAASSPGCRVATSRTFRTNQRTYHSQRASAFSLVLIYLGWAGGFGDACLDLIVHLEAVDKSNFPWL